MIRIRGAGGEIPRLEQRVQEFQVASLCLRRVPRERLFAGAQNTVPLGPLSIRTFVTSSQIWSVSAIAGLLIVNHSVCNTVPIAPSFSSGRL